MPLDGPGLSENPAQASGSESVSSQPYRAGHATFMGFVRLVVDSMFAASGTTKHQSHEAGPK